MMDLQDSLDRAVSDQKLSDIDIDFYYEGIISQLDNLLNLSSKKNFLKKFENKVEDMVGLYPDEIDTLLNSMYNSVIDVISERLNFEVSKEDEPLSALAKNLYKFFVLNYTDNITYFLEMYIIENKQDIAKKLEGIGSAPKRIEGLDSKLSLILNNISDTIEIINGSSVDFSEFIEYVNMHPEASASANEVMEYDKDILSETDNIVDSIFDALIHEEEGFGKIYTELQLNIFNRFKSKDLD